jgi:4-amino-4-deoxy-L-arabinose transferase-like glycosyltransferase
LIQVIKNKAPSAPGPSADGGGPPRLDVDLRIALALTVGLVIVRTFVLFVTPLELHPDEAQYWLWSRNLDWGYFSKPPLIAWIIAATTAIGGDAEAWVRLAGPLLHGVAGLVLCAVGRRLYSPGVGLLALLLYTLMPGVQLSSLVISTDAPLLALLSLGLLAYVSMPAQAQARSVGVAALAGLAFGVAALAKYAAVYALIGLVLHLILVPAARRAWTLSAALAFAAVFAAVLAPNLAWNAAHHFSTMAHTADNAHWSAGGLFNPLELGAFLATQPGVFGLVPAGVLIAGLILARRRPWEPADTLLLCFAAPPLILVAVQALLARANANWAAAAYPAAAVLAAAWLIRWRARGWIIAAVASQALVAMLFVACVTRPSVADSLGLSNSIKRVRGWETTIAGLVTRAREEQGGQRLSAVAVDDRFLFNAAAYYGRDYFGRLGAPPLTHWVRESKPNNQAEVEAPLTRALGRRVLAASYEGQYAAEMAQDFGTVSGKELVGVRLDAKHRRRTELFIGDGFAPRPRDPATGLPPKP